MARLNYIVYLLAILVALSGCSGLIPGDGQASDSPTPFAPRSYDEAVENYNESIREAGQFKLRWERSERFPDRVVNQSPFTTEFVADFESQQFLVGSELEGHNGVYQSGPWYQWGNTTWARSEFDNGTTVYREIPAGGQFTPRNRTLQEIRVMEEYSKQFPLERNGTAIFQGQPVTRYTADELGPNDHCLPQSGKIVENVTSITVVSLVDDRGIIRKFECRLVGETNLGERIEQRMTWTITLVGVVEIREPEPLVNETNGG